MITTLDSIIPTDAQLAELMAPLIGDASPSEYRRAYGYFVWSHLTEPGDGLAHDFIERRGGAWPALLELQAVHERGDVEGTRRWVPRLSTSQLAHTVDLARRANVSMVYPGHPLYPHHRFDDLGHARPLALYCRGDVHLLQWDAAVSVVGARAATSYGEHVTGEIVTVLAADGYLIVSGGAYGIDGKAHRTALAEDKPTVAFLAGGVDRMYPAGHQNLSEHIIRRGLLVSEVPPGSTPTKWRFIARNRLIAALSRVILVVEAGHVSGSLNTASHARRLGRAVGAVPGPLTSVASHGCHTLIREGATLITSAQDVKDLWATVD